MPNPTTIITDSVTIATAVLEITTARGESFTDGLTRLFPNLNADDAEAVANDAQILQEQAENAKLPDA